MLSVSRATVYRHLAETAA
nr:hypothetical protein [Mycolicibacter engbaekii]